MCLFYQTLYNDYQNSLQILSNRHDVIPMVLQDQCELEFPNVGVIELEDLETGNSLFLDTSKKDIQERFKTIMYANQLELKRF